MDSAYLARKICDVISDKGMVPPSGPSPIQSARTGAARAWGDMARTHRDELTRFMDEYHQRSIIEAVFGDQENVRKLSSEP